jgi:hypothetical protein
VYGITWQGVSTDACGSPAAIAGTVVAPRMHAVVGTCGIHLELHLELYYACVSNPVEVEIIHCAGPWRWNEQPSFMATLGPRRRITLHQRAEGRVM